MKNVVMKDTLEIVNNNYKTSNIVLIGVATVVVVVIARFMWSYDIQLITTSISHKQ